MKSITALLIAITISNFIYAISFSTNEVLGKAEIQFTSLTEIKNSGIISFKFSSKTNIRNCQIQLLIPDFVTQEGEQVLKREICQNETIDISSSIKIPNNKTFKIKGIVSGQLDSGEKLNLVKTLFFQWFEDRYLIFNEADIKKFREKQLKSANTSFLNSNQFNSLNDFPQNKSITTTNNSSSENDSITMKGIVKYNNNTGNLKPLTFALVELIQKNESGYKILGESSTNSNGTFNFEYFPNEENISSDENSFIRISTIGFIQQLNNKTQIVRVLDATLKEPYFIDSEIFAINPSVTNKIDLEITIDKSINYGACNVFQTILYGWQKVKEYYNFESDEAIVLWPSSSSITQDTIFLAQGDRWDNDVILHEYGHFIEYRNNFSKNPGGHHYFDENLSSRYDPEIAKNLAWSEGWADYFSVSLQYNDTKDRYFDDTEDIELHVNLEGPIENKGEDCEGAIACILWDIFDDLTEDFDEIKLGLNPAWNLISKNAPINNISQFLDSWDESANGYNSEVNEIYKEYTNIATSIETKFAVETKLKCYPNPFNKQITIEYTLPIDGFTQLEIFNIYGKRVATLISEQQYKNEKYAVKWECQ